MNLTDDQLRESLHARAERIAPPVDVFADVETRARRIRRRRVGASVAGAVAAVVAIAVIVPTLAGTSSHPNRVTVGNTSPNDSVSPSVSSTGTPTVGGEAVLDPSSPWPYRGDDKAIAASTLNRVQHDWSAKYPDSGAIQPLWGEIYEPSQQPELVFVAKVGDSERWGFAMQSHSATQFVVDKPLAAGTTVLAAAVPGDEVSRLLVVTAPSTTAIRYASDGVNFIDMTKLDPGVAVGPLESDPSADKLQVLGVGGRVVFEGPAPDPASTSANAQPANVLGWPTRGTVPSGLTAQLSATYAESRHVPPAKLIVHELVGGTDAGGTQYVLAQVWAAGDDSAATVGFLKHADGTTELQLNATLAATAPVAAIDVTDLPIGSKEWIVVVPQPATGQVLYAADGKTYKPYEATPTADGPVVVPRHPKAQVDRVRVLDGDGKTTFDGTAASLLCGVSGCG